VLCFWLRVNRSRVRQLLNKQWNRFRSQIDSTQYHEIYIGADDELRKATNEADFIFFLQSVHRDLGRIERSHPRDFKIGWLGGRQIVSLTYDTQFTAGTGTEQFDWHISNNRLLLFGYHVTPNASSSK
jgi:hypothetical protein